MTDPTPAPPRKQNALVNIDDLLDLLRVLRKHGYTAKRQGKLAIWKVRPYSPLSAFYACAIKDILVDRFRHVQRGKIIMMDAPEWKVEPQVDYSKLFMDDIVARFPYGR